MAPPTVSDVNFKGHVDEDAVLEEVQTTGYVCAEVVHGWAEQRLDREFLGGTRTCLISVCIPWGGRGVRASIVEECKVHS